MIPRHKRTANSKEPIQDKTKKNTKLERSPSQSKYKHNGKDSTRTQHCSAHTAKNSDQIKINESKHANNQELNDFQLVEKKQELVAIQQQKQQICNPQKTLMKDQNIWEMSKINDVNIFENHLKLSQVSKSAFQRFCSNYRANNVKQKQNIIQEAKQAAQLELDKIIKAKKLNRKMKYYNFDNEIMLKLVLKLLDSENVYKNISKEEPQKIQNAQKAAIKTEQIIPHNFENQLQASKNKIRQLQIKNKELTRRIEKQSQLANMLNQINQKIDENRSWKSSLTALKNINANRNKNLGNAIYSLLFKLSNLTQNQQTLRKNITALTEILFKSHINKTRKKVQINKLLNGIGIFDEEIIQNFQKISQSIQQYHQVIKSDKQTKNKREQQFINRRQTQINQIKKQLQNVKLENKELRNRLSRDQELSNQLNSLQYQMQKQIAYLKNQLDKNNKISNRQRSQEISQKIDSMLIQGLNSQQQLLNKQKIEETVQVQEKYQPQNVVSQIKNINDEGVFRINKCQQEFDIFTDPQSPLHSAPQSVRNLIEKDDFNKIFIQDFDQEMFELHIGSTNICTKLLKPGDRFYVCEECSMSSQDAYRVFCEGCWQSNKHIEHNFTNGSLRQFPGRNALLPFIVCDCGRQQHLKKQSFCSNHIFGKTILTDIPIDERKRFNQFFIHLFYIYLYLKVSPQHALQQPNPHKQLGDKIKLFLARLCYQSIYYIRLTNQVLETSFIDIQGKQTTILQYVIKNKVDMDYLFLSMIADNVFKEKLGRVLIRLGEKELDVINYQIFIDREIAQKYANEGYFFGDSFREKYVAMSQESPVSKSIFYKYLHYKIEHDQNFTIFMIRMLQKDIFCLPKIKKMPIIQQLSLLKKILTKLLSSYETLENQTKIMNETESKGYEKNRCTAILYIIACYCNLHTLNNNKIEGLASLKELGYLKISESAYQKFMNSCLINIQDILNESYMRQQYLIIVFLMLIKQDSRRDQLIKNFWKKMGRKNEKNNIVLVLDSLYHLITLIADYATFEQIYFSKPHFNTDQQRELWLKSLLYERKNIERSLLLKYRQLGDLKFSNAAKIVRQTCKFNEELEQFQYCSEQEFPNYLLQFQVRNNSERVNFQQITLHRLFRNQLISYEDGVIKDIYMMLFCNDYVVGFMQKMWGIIQTARNSSVNLRQSNFGEYYIILLICMQQLTQGSNKYACQQLKNIIQNQEMREILLQSTKQGTISKILGENFNKQVIKNDKIQEKKEEQIDDQSKKMQEVRKKSLQKKNEKYAKIKEKRNKILNTAEQSKQLQSGSEDEGGNQCLICHEKTHKNKKLVYLAVLNNQTISRSFHGKDNKSNTMIQCCFHTVHVDCYTKMIQQETDQFTCPLCSQTRNIILPQKIGDGHILLKCQNSINAFYVMKMKSMNFNGMFPILFKHLLQSYGLNSLISVYLNQSDINKAQKTNKYISKLIKQVLKQASDYQKKEWHQFYLDIIKQINTCQNCVIKDVQIFMATFLYESIVNNINDVQVHKQLISNIYRKLRKDEFEVIMGSVEKILGNKQINYEEFEQEEQKNQQKVSLSFHVEIPPKTVGDFKDKYSQKCSFCHTVDTNIVCLLCNTSICINNARCSGFTSHQEYHSSNMIALVLKDATVNIYRLRNGINMRITAVLYYNFLMVPYHSRKPEQSPKDFQIRSDQFQKIIAFFFMP